jgi:hypothetical protein
LDPLLLPLPLDFVAVMVVVVVESDDDDDDDDDEGDGGEWLSVVVAAWFLRTVAANDEKRCFCCAGRVPSLVRVGRRRACLIRPWRRFCSKQKVKGL